MLVLEHIYTSIWLYIELLSHYGEKGDVTERR